MKIKNTASAGNVAKNDALVTVAPNDADTIEIELISIVKIQFGDQIIKACRETCEEFGVTSAKIRIEDKGALDYVIQARTEAAIKRAQKGNE